jgi:basic membrane protein A
VEGRFEGGVRVLGLRDAAVGYVRNESNAKWLTPEIVARLDRLRDAIVAGQIVVPTE